MKLQIQARSLDISDHIKNHVTAKLETIDRHLPNTARAGVEIASEASRSQRNQVVVQDTLNVSGSLVRAQQLKPNGKAAANSVTQALHLHQGQVSHTTTRPEQDAETGEQFRDGARDRRGCRPAVQQLDHIFCMFRDF